MKYLKLNHNTDPNAFFDFGTRQFAITYKIGRLKADKRPLWAQSAQSRTETIWANSFDAIDSISIVKAFKHDVLSQMIGRNWHSQKTDSFLWESFLETQGKYSWENTNLHYHGTLSGSAVAKISVKQLTDICENSSYNIGMRLFGWEPGVFVEEVKNLDAWRAYTMKNQDELKEGFGGLTILSDNFPRLDFSGRKGVQMK